MSKNELIKAINISKPTKNKKKNIFKSKRKEIKDSLMKLSKEKILKWKIKEIKKILHDPRNNLFKPEKDHYNPTIIGNAFSNNYIEYKSNRDKDELLFFRDYLNMIRTCFSQMVNNDKTQGEWKIKLNNGNQVFFFWTRIMHSPSDNIEVMIDIETDKIIEDLFHSFLQRYQKGLEEWMRNWICFLIVLIHYIINLIE